MASCSVSVTSNSGSSHRELNPKLEQQSCCLSTLNKIKKVFWEFFSALLLVPFSIFFFTDMLFGSIYFFTTATILNCSTAVKIYLYFFSCCRRSDTLAHQLVNIARYHQRGEILQIVEEWGFSNGMANYRTSLSSGPSIERLQEEARRKISGKIDQILQLRKSRQERAQKLSKFLQKQKETPFPLYVNQGIKYIKVFSEKGFWQQIPLLVDLFPDEDINLLLRSFFKHEISSLHIEGLSRFLDGLANREINLDTHIILLDAIKNGRLEILPKLMQRTKRFQRASTYLFLKALIALDRSEEEILSALKVLVPSFDLQLQSNIDYFFTLLERKYYRAASYLLSEKLYIPTNEKRLFRALQKISDKKAIQGILTGGLKQDSFKNILFFFNKNYEHSYSNFFDFLQNLKKASSLFLVLPKEEFEKVEDQDARMQLLDLQDKLFSLFLSQTNERHQKVMDEFVKDLQANQTTLIHSIQKIGNEDLRTSLYSLVQKAILCRKFTRR